MRDFRTLFQAGRLATIVGAYDAITASLIERTGFDAIWVSSYCVSLAQYTLPDANIVSAAEMLEAARRMRAASSLPMMLDAGNGYGSLPSLQRAVQDCLAAGVQAICIDDNAFPETSSLYGGTRRSLVSIEEMQARIACAKGAADGDRAMFVTARTEALIADTGEADAVRRALAYVDAGADAVLVHARAFERLAAVVDVLDVPVPIIAIPTLYPDVSPHELLRHNIAAAILANQALRASIRAIARILERMKDASTFREVEDEIVPLRDIEEMVGLASYALR